MMNEWIDKLEEEDIYAIGRARNRLKNVPERVDRVVFTSIEQEKNIHLHRGFSYRRIIAFAAAAAIIMVLLPVLFFFIQNNAQLKTRGILISGTVSVKKEGNIRTLAAGDEIEEKSELFLESDSNLVLAFGENVNAKLMGPVRLRCMTMRKNSILLDLHKGEIAANIERKMDFSIITEKARIYSIGTQFIVRSSENNTDIAVYRGSVRVEMEKEDRTEVIIVAQGERYRAGETIETSDSLLSARMKTLFTHLTGLQTAEVQVLRSTLVIKTNVDDVYVVLNGSEVDIIDNEVTLSLLPGTFTVTLKKEGYDEIERTIELVEGESEIIEAELKKAGSDESKDLLPWEWKKGTWEALVFSTYHNVDTPEYNNILGFAVSEDVAIAVSQTVLICIDRQGHQKWRKEYGLEQKIIFTTIPVIHGKKAYCATNYMLLIIDIESGNEQRVYTPGVLSNGQKMVVWYELLLIPYPESVYAFNMRTQKLSLTPFIRVEGVMGPVIAGNTLYVSSVYSGEIGMYDRNGEKVGEKILPNKSITVPLLYENYVYVSDTEGILYRLTDTLQFVDSLNVSAPVVSITGICSHQLLLHTANGSMLTINLDQYIRGNIIELEKGKNPHIYMYKNPITIGNNIFMGTDDGTIRIFDCKDVSRKGLIEVSDSPVSCTIKRFGDTLLVGTTAGEIILLHYKIYE